MDRVHSDAKGVSVPTEQADRAVLTLERHPRKLLPTKDQINAISGIDDLEAMRDEIDRRIARIEADLDFRDDTVEWEGRAISALAIHRYTFNLISRRLKALRQPKNTAFAVLAGVRTTARERVECHALSWQLIDGDFPNADEVPEGEIDTALGFFTEAIEALDKDRREEVALVPTARDEAWLAEANVALRKARATRHDLTIRRARMGKAAKEALQRERDATRPQAFVEEARALLPRETFLTIWDRVDRRMMEPTTASSVGTKPGTGEVDQTPSPQRGEV